MLLKNANERVVVPLRDRIELVIVAAGALERQPEERGAEGLHAVGDVFDAELLLDAAAFVRLPVQAVEGGGEPLLVASRSAADRRRAAR